MTELEILKLRRLARVSVDGEPLTIGRSSKNGLVLPHSSVSRRHCVIEVVDGVPRLIDNGSTRGTRVNGRKVSEWTLRDGDRIQVGPFELTVRGTGSGPADEPPGGDDVGVFEAANGVAESDGTPATATDDDPDVDANDTHAVVPSIGPGDAERETLERRQAELDEQETRAREREATLDAREEEIEHRWQEIVGGRRQHEQDRTALEREQETIAEERRALETERVTRQEQLESLHERIETLTGEVDAERARLGEAETRAETIARELTTQRDAFEGAAAAAMGEAEAARERTAAVDAARGPLADACRRLTELQRSLRALEALWTETDEWVAEAEDTDHEDLARVLQQRDAVGEQLADAHGQRDELIAEMTELVRRLAG